MPHLSQGERERMTEVLAIPQHRKGEREREQREEVEGVGGRTILAMDRERQILSLSPSSSASVLSQSRVAELARHFGFTMEDNPLIIDHIGEERESSRRETRERDEEREREGEREEEREEEEEGGEEEEEQQQQQKKGEEEEGAQLSSVITFVLDTFRRSGLLASCKPDPPPSANGNGNGNGKMEIGRPSNVKHIAHVTFDRFKGFLGLPVEFELQIPRRVPSASASVFGVSAESMQCSYDKRGNSVPTIILLMQERLYEQGGLKAEGIFRINGGSSEEYVRDELNKGIVPYNIDVHCLAGLIKAWFRELPRGVLDTLSLEQIVKCVDTEEQCLEMVESLPFTEAALLNWAVNLMADVVEEQDSNKMNAHNIAMVFAPNMSQMADSLTALMRAVQVINLLKTLILRTIRERKQSMGPRLHQQDINSSVVNI